jgi:hypothetical protein
MLLHEQWPELSSELEFGLKEVSTRHSTESFFTCSAICA